MAKTEPDPPAVKPRPDHGLPEQPERPGRPDQGLPERPRREPKEAPPPTPNAPATPEEQAELNARQEKIVEAFHKAKAEGTPDAAPHTKAEQDAIE